MRLGCFSRCCWWCVYVCVVLPKLHGNSCEVLTQRVSGVFKLHSGLQTLGQLSSLEGNLILHIPERVHSARVSVSCFLYANVACSSQSCICWLKVWSFLPFFHTKCFCGHLLIYRLVVAHSHCGWSSPSIWFALFKHIFPALTWFHLDVCVHILTNWLSAFSTVYWDCIVY